MAISSMIRADLWQSVSNAYNAENYKSAILDAMHFLTKMIREKADLDLDGSKLVNEVFGGKNPKIKINKYETQTDLDEQQGFTFLLLGLYQGIRNPSGLSNMNLRVEVF